MKDPLIRKLAKRVETKAERECQPGDKTIEVRLQMADGKSHSLLATTFPGAADCPLDYKGVVEKFRRFTSKLLTEKRAAEIIDRCGGRKVRDMAELQPDTSGSAANASYVGYL